MSSAMRERVRTVIEAMSSSTAAPVKAPRASKRANARMMLRPVSDRLRSGASDLTIVR